MSQARYPLRHPHSLTPGTLVARHRPARLRHPHSLSLYCEHLHQYSRIHLMHGLLLNHSRLEPWRTSPHRFRRLHMLSQLVPRIVGTRLSQLLRRFQGLLRLFILRISTPFARARIAAAQSRVAAPVLSDPRPPPSAPVFSPFRDGHYWCSKCPRRGFTTIPGLMRHVTHQHAGSSVDEATCSLFAAIERVTCTAPGCGGLRRMGARICNRCGQASQARPPKVG